MKKIILLLLAMCLMFATACKQTNNAFNADEIWHGSRDDVFDEAKQYAPNADKVKMLNEAMTMKQVLNIMGKPHYEVLDDIFSSMSNPLIPVTIGWYLEDGGKAEALFRIDYSNASLEDMNKLNTWEQLVNYSHMVHLSISDSSQNE